MSKPMAAIKCPKRLLESNRIGHGYKGQPYRVLTLDCGHSIFVRDWLSRRESCYKPGQTKLQCWQCAKAAEPNHSPPR